VLLRDDVIAEDAAAFAFVGPESDEFESVVGGAVVALGRDGAASNANQNMFETMRFAELIHTLYGHHSTWPSAEMVWSAGLRGGAAALGSPLGSLRPGAAADLVLLDLDRHVAVNTAGLVASLVRAEHGESVHSVIVGGELVVSERTSTRVDDGEMGRRSRELQTRIHAARPSRIATYERYEEYLTAVTDDAMSTPLALERRAAVTPAFEASATR